MHEYGDICERNGIIMGDEMLASVCELAFDVAKEGSAPSAMKNYLYLAQRPPRAYSVAQRALEEDTSFRARVADRATIENVGEAGYLWLHRPAGWEQRFSALTAGVESIDGAPSGETPLAQRPPMPAAPSIDSIVSSSPVSQQPTPATRLPSQSPVESSSTPEQPRPAVSSTVSSIEDELSNLRGLVDRLADERKNVRSSVTELEVELETRRAENIEMSTKLSALRTELTTVQSTESTILLDRDRALARVTELEADVARLTTEVERMAAEAEGSSSEHEAALTDLAIVSSERDSLRGELDTVKAEREINLADLQALRAQREQLSEAAAERDAIRSELDSLQADHELRLSELETVRGELSDVVTQRSSLQGELDAVTTDRNSLTGQFNETLAERDQLQANLDTANSELGELRSQLATVEGERSEMAERVAAMDALSTDNAELASRLSVAEQARVDLEGQLEDVSEKWKTAARQLSVFENVNSQLDTVASERDALQEQLHQATEALTELHVRIGTSHEQIRSELTSIEATFGDRVESLPLTGATADSEPDVGTSDLDLPEFSAPDFTEPDPDTAELDTPHIDAPDLDDVDDLDVPSFGDGVDFGADDSSPLDADESDLSTEPAEGEEFFDGEGIEMDPATLGGRTIGDMFGGGDESTIDAELPTGDAEHTMNGNTSPDAPGLDELLQAAADEPLGTEPIADDGPDADEPSVADAGRRRLSIPAGLDDKTFARHVVDSPDVILLIDGDGAAAHGWPHLDVAGRRSALVGYLHRLSEETGAAADVVFVRAVGDEDALPVARKVLVRIVDDDVAESPIFSSIVDRYPGEWPIAIITDEPALRAQAEGLEATALSSDQLLDLFLDLNSDS